VKVLVTGAGGQAGTELQRTAPKHVDLVCADSKRIDLTNPAQIEAVVREIAPNLIINAAAYTAVDKAESERERAYAVNAAGIGHLAAAAHATGARLIHISTDFVFDGMKSTPYLPSDPTNPLGVYGASKREGERLVSERSSGTALIVRTAWLYSPHGNNFAKTMLRLMRERDQVGVVADQTGTPTSARSLAEALWAAAERPALTGIYHWSDAGVASWYDFAVAIQEEALSIGFLSRPIPIRPIRTEDYPTPARRPGYSVLDKTATWADFGIDGKHWRACLRTTMEELNHA
jgi:dTDP-4-dehydrorhamnose reductase